MYIDHTNEFGGEQMESVSVISIAIIASLLLMNTIFAAEPVQSSQDGEAPQVSMDDFSQYIGRYKKNDDSVVYVFVHNDTLTLRPIFLISIQRLQRVNGDEFVVSDFPDRHAIFQRAESGEVSGLRLIFPWSDQVYSSTCNGWSANTAATKALGPRAPVMRQSAKKRIAAEIAWIATFVTWCPAKPTWKSSRWSCASRSRAA